MCRLESRADREETGVATAPPPKTDTATTTTKRDRRHVRHEATRREILGSAWTMVRADGLAALSVRALARNVGMEPQSLYTYFDSKNAVYDAMYAQGSREFADALAAVVTVDEPLRDLKAMTHFFVGFCAENSVRYQLLFQRTIPGFEPSADSYAIAAAALQSMQERLAPIGLTDRRGVDLLTAIANGPCRPADLQRPRRPSLGRAH